MKVRVIVPTFDRPEDLAALLSDLAEIDTADLQVSVLIVDNGSRDGTDRVPVFARLGDADTTPLTLTVETGCLVKRITFAGNRATGVEYTTGSGGKTARADSEVIVTSGAVSSG